MLFIGLAGQRDIVGGSSAIVKILNSRRLDREFWHLRGICGSGRLVVNLPPGNEVLSGSTFFKKIPKILKKIENLEKSENLEKTENLEKV